MLKSNRIPRASGTLVAVALLTLVGCSSPQSDAGPQTVEGKQPDGTVDMSEAQAAYIGSASGGNGTLFFNGESYPFSADGLGIGGVGASSIDASGEVYNLHNVRQFPGQYAQGRYGFALGTESAGDLWLKNENDVVLHLKAKRTGLMLSLGGDVVAISMTQ